MEMRNQYSSYGFGNAYSQQFYRPNLFGSSEAQVEVAARWNSHQTARQNQDILKSINEENHKPAPVRKPQVDCNLER